VLKLNLRNLKLLPLGFILGAPGFPTHAAGASDAAASPSKPECQIRVLWKSAIEVGSKVDSALGSFEDAGARFLGEEILLSLVTEQSLVATGVPTATQEFLVRFFGRLSQNSLPRDRDPATKSYRALFDSASLPALPYRVFLPRLVSGFEDFDKQKSVDANLRPDEETAISNIVFGSVLGRTQIHATRTGGGLPHLMMFGQDGYDASATLNHRTDPDVKWRLATATEQFHSRWLDALDADPVVANAAAAKTLLPKLLSSFPLHTYFNPRDRPRTGDAQTTSATDHTLSFEDISTLQELALQVEFSKGMKKAVADLVENYLALLKDYTELGRWGVRPSKNVKTQVTQRRTSRPQYVARPFIDDAHIRSYLAGTAERFLRAAVVLDLVRETQSEDKLQRGRGRRELAIKVSDLKFLRHLLCTRISSFMGENTDDLPDLLEKQFGAPRDDRPGVDGGSEALVNAIWEWDAFEKALRQVRF